MTRRAVEELVDRCLLVGFEETEPPEWLLRAAPGVGGVVLYGSNLRVDGDVTRLAGVVRASADVLIAVDEEGGDVTRLHYRQGSPDPGNLVLGLADDVEVTTAVAGAIGARLRAAGVGLNLAPVVDVNADPENPVIGVRSFGADPDLVRRHAGAWIRATQAQGVAACAKHFPGHGDTHVDSHLDLPGVTCDERQWRAVHLPPFAAALEAGVCSVMTAHLRIPALDDAPATLSRRILTDLLRGELGFDGAVITDALDMGAVTRGVGVRAAAVRALAAGADALCLGSATAQHQYHQVRSAVTAAVLLGDLPRSRLEAAVARVDQLHAWVAAAAVLAAPDPGGTRDLGLAAVRRTVRANRVPPLPGPPVVIELRDAANLAVGDARWDLGGAMAALGCPPARVFRFAGLDRPHQAGSDPHQVGSDPDGAGSDPDGAGSDPDGHGAPGVSGVSGVLALAAAHPVVVVGRDVPRRAGQRAVWDQVVAARPDAILVDVGLPRPGDLAGVRYVLVGGAARPNLRVAAEVLLRGAG